MKNGSGIMKCFFEIDVDFKFESVIFEQHSTKAENEKNILQHLEKLQKEKPQLLKYPKFQSDLSSAKKILTKEGDDDQYIIISSDNDCPFLQDEKHLAAIHIAAKLGYPNLIKKLVDMGENVNRKDGYARTPLHYAAINNDHDTIELIKSLGGNVLSRDSFGDIPLELIQNGVEERTIRLLQVPNPTQDKSTNINKLQNKLRYRNINVKTNVDDIFILMAQPNMLKLYPDGKRLSTVARDKGLKEEFVKLIYFIEEYINIHIEHGIVVTKQMRSGLDPKSADISYINLMSNLLKLISKTGLQNNPYYFYNIKKAFSILAGICNAISWNLKKCFFDLIPWQDIELFYALPNTHDPLIGVYLKEYLKDIVENSIPVLLTNIETLKNSKERWYKDDKSELPGEKMIDGLDDLYGITSSLMDLFSLDKMRNFTSRVSELNPDKEGDRKSLLSIVKLIGELSKYNQLSKNLSFAVQNMFKNVPWHIFVDLRNLIAKSIETPSRVSAYLSLTQNENNKELFIEIKNTLILFGKEVIRVSDKFAIMVEKPSEVKELYKENVSGIHLSAEEFEQLKTDLKTGIDSKVNSYNSLIAGDSSKLTEIKGKKNKKIEKRIETHKSKRTNFEKSYQDIVTELDDVKKINKNLKNNISQFYQNITGIEDCKKRWNETFSGKCSEEYKSLVTLKDRLNVRNLQDEVIDYNNLSKNILDKLLSYYMDSESLEKMLSSGVSLSESDTQLQKKVYNNFKLYETDFSRFLRFQHDMCDLHECLDKTSISIPSYKMLRNFLEHRNSIIMLSRARDQFDYNIFMQALGILLQVRIELYPLIERLNANRDKTQNTTALYSMTKHDASLGDDGSEREPEEQKNISRNSNRIT